MNVRVLKGFLTGTVLSGAMAFANPAFAQDSQPADQASPDSAAPVDSPQSAVDSEKSSREIIVTGSRIPQPNLEAASPVTVVSSQDVKLSGTSRTEDLVNSLPQVFAAQGSNVSNGATGAATINLRGLGTKETMVLVNGRRLQPGDPRQPVSDIDFIPNQLIKRVDVLTGGASSVYGADAVAGVVNFVMDTTFTGFRIDGQASVFNHHQHAGHDILLANDLGDYDPPQGWSTNGGAQDIAAVFGAAFDDGRGHVQAYATYRTQDPVLQATRDHSFCSLGSNAPQYIPDYGEYYCGGSATSAQGTFLNLNPVTGKTNVYHVEGNQFVAGAIPFNYAPYNYFQRPDERYTFGTFADYEITAAFHPYMEAMFMIDQSDAQIAPSGDFGNTRVVACDNALLSQQQRDLVCAPGQTFVGALNGQQDIEQARLQILRRNVEGGGRDDDLVHTSYRIVAGMRGDVANGVAYDAYYQFGTTHLQDVYRNDFSVTRLGRAIDAVAVLDGQVVAPGTPGSTIMCRAALTGVDPACVPYNIFAAGAVDPAALTYLQTPLFQTGHIDETIAHVDATFVGGDYGLRLPWAENGIGINVGAEYRKELQRTDVDENFRLGEGAGQGGPTPPTQGSFDVRELFGEIQLPIVENNFIDLFQVTAGYRYSNYHVGANSFSTDTYKLAAELAPIPDIKARASYNRAVRAPNVIELFFPESLGLAGNTDPCATATPTASLAQCQNTGVTAAQYGNILKNPASQYQALGGGNPDLQPEKADTFSAGVVLQPRFIPGLALTADYFDIKIDNLITPGFGFNTVMNACLQSGQLCNLIHRDSSGSLWLSPDGYIDLRNINVGGERTKGIDVNASYSRRLGGVGTLNFSFVGTWLDELSFNSGIVPGNGLDGRFDCAGFYGGTCGTPVPEWRHKLRIGLTTPAGIGISGQWRYFSSVTNDTLSSDPDLTAGGAPESNPGDAKLNSRSYFDLALTARLAQRLELRFGANNILDTDAPVNGLGIGNGNTFPQVYDALGRYLFAGFTIDF